MPQPPTIFPKLQVSSRPPDLSSAPNTGVPFSAFRPSQFTTDPGSHHQIYRTKRKHVLKACDRCRVKKTKCDGNQPCYRCASYDHPCLFRERKATQTKAYSKGFVEMLESHHALVVKALQQLYTHCINNECFPGEPIDVVDGYPLTHAILDRLGLIKQAENESEELCPAGLAMPRFWEGRRSSSDSIDTNEMSPLSPEPTGGIARSPSSLGRSSPDNPDFGTVKGEPPAGSHGVYDPYLYGEQAWTLSGQPARTASVHLNHDIGGTDYNRVTEPAPPHTMESANAAGHQSRNDAAFGGQVTVAMAGSLPQPGNHVSYTSSIPHIPHQITQSTFESMGPQYSWNFGTWTR